jgi:transposase
MFNYKSPEKQDITQPVNTILETERIIEELKRTLHSLESKLYNQKLELQIYLASQIDEEAILVTVGEKKFAVMKGVSTPVIKKIV